MSIWAKIMELGVLSLWGPARGSGRKLQWPR